MNANIAQLNRDRSPESYALSVVRHTKELARIALSYRYRVPRNKIRFVIFGQGRCGSTLLETLLDSHAEISCHDELLSMRHLFPFARLERFEREALASHYAFGFHLKPWHVTRVMRRDLLSFTRILDERGYLFIHLQRANWFLQSLSQVKLLLHRVIHATSADMVPKGNLYVDPELLILLLKEKESLAVQEAAVMSSISRPPVKVVYERDLLLPEVQQATASRIFRELGIADFTVNTPLRKVSPDEWRSGVSNVEEVEQSVRLAGFDRFLEK